MVTRRKRNSASCSVLILDTKVPRWGNTSRRPFWARRIKASRTGVRLTDSIVDSSCSDMAVPGTRCRFMMLSYNTR